MDAQRVFEWFPIQRLHTIGPKHDDDITISLATSSMHAAMPTGYEAAVSDWVPTDSTGLMGYWGDPYDIDITSAALEMQRRNGGDVLYRFSRDEDPQAARDRIRDEVNAAAEAVAARYVECSPRV